MRTIFRLAAVLVLAACAPGRVIIVERPAPPPPPPPPRIEPLEVAVARPVRGHLLIQTNRPAYVAIFEIVPERGVALLAPTYVHQRTWMLAGLNWVPVSWKVQSTMYYGPPSARGVPGRWVYAIASDEPLRLPEDAFRPGYLQRVLGPTVHRSRNPYITMRALSRAFVPAIADEAWAEDAYALAATYASDSYRTVRIYCANRTVYEVPEELADRAWCPVAQGNTGASTARTNPSRPDSVVASNGVRVRRRVPETRSVYRVREPATTRDAPPSDPGRTNTNPGNNTTNNAGNANSGGSGAGNASNGVTKDSSRARRGGGNAYGHTDDPNVRGRGIENEKQQRQTAPTQDDKGRPKDKELDVKKAAPPSNAGIDPRRGPRVDAPTSGRADQQVAKPDRPAQAEEKPAHQHERPNELKQEEKRAQKQDDRPPEKAADPAPKGLPERIEAPAQQPQADKQDAKPDKPEAKPEPKPESDAKGQGKPDDKADAKGAKGQTGGPEEPGKKDQKGKP